MSKWGNFDVSNFSGKFLSHKKCVIYVYNLLMIENYSAVTFCKNLPEPSLRRLLQLLSKLYYGGVNAKAIQLFYTGVGHKFESHFYKMSRYENSFHSLKCNREQNIHLKCLLAK